MEKRNKAIAIAKPYFAGDSKHEELFITSDEQVFTQAHLADSHAQTQKDKTVEIVSKDNVLKNTIVVPEVEDRPIIIPVTADIIDAKAEAIETADVEPLVDVTGEDAPAIDNDEKLVIKKVAAPKAKAKSKK